MSPVSGGPLLPVAVCARFVVSVLWKTTVCPRQVVTLTGTVAAAALQFTVMGDALTVSRPEPVLPDTVAWMATGPPLATPRASPAAGSTVATPVFPLLQLAAGALATRLPRASNGVAANCWVVQRGIDAVAGST